MLGTRTFSARESCYAFGILVMFVDFILLIVILYNLAALKQISKSVKVSSYDQLSRSFRVVPTETSMHGLELFSTSNYLNCIQAIRKRQVETVRDIFGQPHFLQQPIILVDPAQHGNIGDVMIAHGERQFASTFGWGSSSILECSLLQARTEPRCTEFVLTMKEVAPEALVMWQGGGNWGDRYKQQDHRLEHFGSFLRADATIVSMPQSIWYKDETRLRADARKLEAIMRTSVAEGTSKQRLVLLWRQQDSHDLAQQLYPFADNRLMPDIAFMIGPYIHHGAVITGDEPERVDVLVFLRLDLQSVIRPMFRRPEHIAQRLEAAAPGANLTFRLANWSDVQTYRYAASPGEYEPRIDAGVRLINGGRVVVTDLLQVTTLCVMSLRPVFYVDQIYHKINRTLETALSSSPACRDTKSVRVFQSASVGDALARAAAFVLRCKAAKVC